MSSRHCVYTTLIGGYERLNEQPVAKASSLPFICLTDDGHLESETWQIQLVRPIFGMDPVRSQRELKIRPHAHLPGYGRSLYIDNSVVLTHPPELLFENQFPKTGLRLPEHSYRKTVLDEFVEVSRLGFDDQNRIFEQLNHYMCDNPSVLEEAPYWTAILLRDHGHAGLRDMLDIWASHVLRYSRRDQLSFNFACRHAGFKPDAWQIDNYESWFHTWPHTAMRQRDKGMRSPALALSPPAARIRSLEMALTEQEDKRQSLEMVIAAQELKHQKLVRNPGRILKLAAKQTLRGWRSGLAGHPLGPEELGKP